MNARTPILRIVCAGAAILAITGCHKSQSGNGPTSPSGPPSPGATIVYTAIGASDANGIGSSVPCSPLTDCPTGTGYVPVTSRQLHAQGFTVTTTNLGIPTAVIGPDIQSLAQRYGRAVLGNFIDHEAPLVPPNTTLVTIFAGGNDANAIVAAAGAGAGGPDPIGFIDAQVSAFASDYATLVQRVRARAADPRFVLINLPNLGALPYLAAATTAQRLATQRTAVGMTRAVNALASNTIRIVDVMCDARSYDTSLYSSDGFHPNDAGYTYLAGELVRAITSATYPQPQSSCSFMTLVP